METLLRVALDSLSWIIGFWTLVGYKAINKCLVIIIHGLRKKSRVPQQQARAPGKNPQIRSQLTLGT